MNYFKIYIVHLIYINIYIIFYLNFKINNTNHKYKNKLFYLFIFLQAKMHKVTIKTNTKNFTNVILLRSPIIFDKY